jgi:hypothetical protein
MEHVQVVVMSKSCGTRVKVRDGEFDLKKNGGNAREGLNGRTYLEVRDIPVTG